MLTPVLWNPSVVARFTDNSNGGGSGGIELPIEPDYNFFTLDNLDAYLSLKFEASLDRYGILFDSLKARYQDSATVGSTGFGIGTELGFVELAGRYQIMEDVELDFIAGVRRAFLDIDQTLSTGSAPAQSTTYSFAWTDPLIGLRYRYRIAQRWRLWLRGDIGGFDVSTQRVINSTLDVQYLINDTLSVSLGYRYFEIDFKEDDILYDVTLNGMQVSLGIHF